MKNYLKPLNLYRIDWVLIVCVVAVVCLGLPFLKSSSREAEFNRQLIWLSVGFAALLFCLRVDYHFWRKAALPLYGLTLALLVGVFFVPAINNTYRYIRLGPVGIQPAELAKLSTILMLAVWLSETGHHRKWYGLIVPFGLAFLPMLLILRQPDLGTVLTFPPMLFVMLWMSGARLVHLATTAIAGLASCWPLWLYGMRPYQKTRIYAFLNPERYETAEAYQMLMSLTAIGSGGFAGLGIGNGVITNLDLLPEMHNDFIFGVVAEEGGFAAAGSMLFLFLIITLICLHIAGTARDRLGTLLAAGVAASLGWQVIQNIYVVTGLFPTTGVTLPLVSYGGSSMVVTCAMMGMVVNIGQAEPTLQKILEPDRI